MEPKPGNTGSDDELFAAFESEFNQPSEASTASHDYPIDSNLLPQLESEAVVDRQLLAEVIQLRIIDLEAAGVTPDVFAIDVAEVPFGAFGNCLLSADIRVGNNGVAQGWIQIESTDPSEESPLPRTISRPEDGRWVTTKPINDKLRSFSDTGIVKTLSAQWPEHRFERGEVHKYSYEDTVDEYTAKDIARIIGNQLAPHADHYVTSSEFSQYTYDQSVPDWQNNPKGKVSLIYGRERSADGEASIAISMQQTVYHEIDGDMYSVVACAQLDEYGNVAVDTYCVNNETHVRTPLPVDNEPRVILELLTSLNGLVSSRI